MRSCDRLACSTRSPQGRRRRETPDSIKVADVSATSNRWTPVAQHTAVASGVSLGPPSTRVSALLHSRCPTLCFVLFRGSVVGGVTLACGVTDGGLCPSLSRSNTIHVTTHTTVRVIVTRHSAASSGGTEGEVSRVVVTHAQHPLRPLGRNTSTCSHC